MTKYRGCFYQKMYLVFDEKRVISYEYTRRGSLATIDKYLKQKAEFDKISRGEGD